MSSWGSMYTRCYTLHGEGDAAGVTAIQSKLREYGMCSFFNWDPRPVPHRNRTPAGPLARPFQDRDQGLEPSLARADRKLESAIASPDLEPLNFLWYNVFSVPAWG
jgi:hypothetical protein